MSESAYIATLRRQRKLTPAQESALLAQWLNEGKLAARDRIVTAYLPLIVKIAAPYARANPQIKTDLINEGVIGAMVAIDSYNPSHQALLASWIYLHARAQMSRYTLNQRSPLSLKATEPVKRVLFHKDRVKQKLGLHGTLSQSDIKAVAAELGVAPSTYITAVNATEGIVALDAPRETMDGPAEAAINNLADLQPSPLEQVMAEELRAKGSRLIAEAVATLRPRDREIFNLYHLSDDSENITFREIGPQFGLTNFGAHVVCRKAYEKVRYHVLAHNV